MKGYIKLHKDYLCPACFENRDRAIKQHGIYEGYCYNCTYTGNRYNTCFSCGCIAPYEMHHVIPQRLYVGHLEAKVLVPLCLNCHRCITCRFERLLWEYKATGQLYDKQDMIVEAKRMLFEMFEERHAYYAKQERADYSVLTRTYRNREYSNHVAYKNTLSDLV